MDVASFQHPAGAAINWADVAAGIQFAAVKATEGAYYPNPYALADLADARAAGLSTAAYAFAIPNGNGASSSPVAQADYFLTDLGAAAGTVPLMLDIEYDPYISTDKTNECYGLSPSAMVSWISSFSAEVRSKTGRLPIIYTPPSWWSTCTGGSTAFGQTPAWVPQFGNVASPALPDGWSAWSFWQYTSTGTVSGIATTGSTDLDQLNPAVLPLLDPGNQQNVSGGAIGWQLQRADPVTGQLPSFSATGLPAGVTVGSSGRVTGWAGRPGTYQATMRATASEGGPGSVSFAWTVRPAPDTGPTGRIWLDLGGKCLNDSGNHSANLTPVNIWTCSLSAAQQWTVAQDNTVRIHGKCLDDSGNSTANGNPIDLYSCTGTTAQAWQARPDNTVRLHGKCLDVYHAGRSSGTPPDLYTCNGTAAQQWRVVVDGAGTRLVNPASGLCLGDPADATANGTKLEMITCRAGDPGMNWRVH